MSQPTEQQIIAALEASGYLFEQDVATQLVDLGFHVETNYAFEDHDLDKSREIDVRAVKRVAVNEAQKLQFWIELLVECKDFASPLVFLERRKNALDATPSEPKEFIFPFRVMQKRLDANSYREVPAFEHLGLKEHHYYLREPNKATQFSKIVRKGSEWTANHEGIYDSLVLPLAKLLEVRRVDVLRHARSSNGWRSVWLFFPMVVVRDHLFAYDLSVPQRELIPRRRVTFVRHLDSDKLKGRYMIDFLTFNGIGTYLSQDIEGFCAPIRKLVEDDPSALANKPA